MLPLLYRYDGSHGRWNRYFECDEATIRPISPVSGDICKNEPKNFGLTFNNPARPHSSQ